MDKKIFVTQPSLPPLEEFIPYLEKIWDNKWLTNNGPYHQLLEKNLCEYLGVEYLSLFTNGTIALVTALQTLRITGEVITTPYTFVATAHSLFWNNIKPVFVDIDPETMNLCPSKIEAAITPSTMAILPVHCYGAPCNVDEIQDIADRYGLKIIYDAAHAFGVKQNNNSILLSGDLSILSFHATKVFNTFEGGAIICPDQKTKNRIDYLKNFGFADEVTVVAPGINGKMSEFQAAMGVLQLKHIDSQIEQRMNIDSIYRNGLKNCEGIKLLKPRSNSTSNYSYFPIFVKSNFACSRDSLYERLKEQEIFVRRYFFPLVSDMPMYRGCDSASHENLYNAVEAASNVICLPMYSDLAEEDALRVVDIILQENN